MTEQQIPAGMKPWAGGDAAPEDWDGGPVLSADGLILRGVPDYDWRRESDEEGAVEGWCILAYTPKATPSPPVDGEKMERAFEAFLDAIEPAVRAKHESEWPNLPFKPWRGEREKHPERWTEIEPALRAGLTAALAALSSPPSDEPAKLREAFTAGFHAAERGLGFEGCDESADALAIEWAEYLEALSALQGPAS